MAADQGQPQTIDDYINSFPEDVRRILNSIRQTVREAAPEAQTSIHACLSFGIQRGFEYPPGNFMRVNDWQLDLFGK